MTKRLLIRILGFIAGIIIAGLLYYWLWTESGPCGWIGDLLVSVLGALGARWTFISVIFIWLVLALLAFLGVCHGLKKLAPGDDQAEGAASGSLLLGMMLVPLAVLLISLKGSIGGLMHRKPESIQATALAREAGWMPRNVKIEGGITFDEKSLVATRSITSYTSDVFLPVRLDAGDNPKSLHVFLKTSDVFLKKLKDDSKALENIEGTLAYEPLPSLTRREIQINGGSAPLFAVVIEHERGAFGYWFAILLAHLVPFGVFALNYLYWAPKEKTAKAAAEQAKATPP